MKIMGTMELWDHEAMGKLRAGLHQIVRSENKTLRKEKEN